MQVAPLLRERYGIETIVLLPEEPGNAAERLRDNGIDVVEVPVARLRAKADPRYHWRFLRDFGKSVRAIAEIIRERGIDLVQINGISNPHAAVAARRLAVPVIWQMLDTFPPPWFLRGMMLYVRHSAAALMATGKKVAEQHPGATAFAEKLVYFFPPVNTAAFTFTPEKRQAARRELGIADDCPVVGNVSNLNPQKGHRTFIQVVARVSQHYPQVKFIILGRRYEAHRQYIENLFSEAEALGLDLDDRLIVRDPGERVAELAPAFDIFLMTPRPRSEGIPTVIEEAMTLGLPVVAGDVGAISEIIRDAETGFLVAAEDLDRFVQRTCELLADASLRKRLGDAACDFANRHFTVEQCAERHVEACSIALERELKPAIQQ